MRTRNIDCPQCGAAPGEKCRGKSGKPLLHFHAARVQAARAVKRIRRPR